MRYRNAPGTRAGAGAGEDQHSTGPVGTLAALSICPGRNPSGAETAAPSAAAFTRASVPKAETQAARTPRYFALPRCPFSFFGWAASGFSESYRTMGGSLRPRESNSRW